MTKSKEFEIRKGLFRLFIYNRYKYDLRKMDYYNLMDFISVDGEDRFKLIDKIFIGRRHNGLSVTDFCDMVTKYSLYKNLTHEEIIDSMFIDPYLKKIK